MAKGKNKGKYDDTLNLPRTKFPMRAKLPTKEPEMLKFWEEIDLYQSVQEKNQGKPLFILHDGPPYANGHIHVGHTLNKVLKDIIIKHKSMTGYDAPYVPGWDTHGLPIEQQAIKELGIDRSKADVLEFRRRCKDYALRYVDLQRDEFIRLGVRGDWDNPYLTLNPKFEAVQIEVFGEMAKKGYIYKGLKPVYWCAHCETALAEADIEYADKTSPSIYVKFPVRDAQGLFPIEDTYVIIWTTTPWTLPANTGISVHPDFDYVLVAVGEEKYVVAKELLESVAEAGNWQDYQVVQEFKGIELDRAVCRHPFVERDSLVVCGRHVTLEQGTGCVHTAPGHGDEDFVVGQEYDLPIISPLDDRGVFTEEGGQFAGQFCYDANDNIIAHLDKLGMLVKHEDIVHQYPHCWRCKEPIIYRATEQWFVSIDGFRQQALEAIDKVRWIPAWGRDRIYNMVQDRGDWCISRQRTWGVPIPIFYCQSCGETVINDETIQQVKELFARHGSDIWFASTAHELLPDGYQCPDCGGTEFTKESDTMDVWFDSGSTHKAVLETRPDQRWPADMYLEGSDQHRGWFNSSLSTAVAVTGEPPYKMVLTHGFTVDEKGRKMSKSLGNVLDPLKITDRMGADILRLWVASADYRGDIAASDNIMKQAAEAYRKIRNTCRFILGNIADFDYQQHRVPYEEMGELDRWALLRLHKLIARVSQAYDDFEFHVVYHGIHNFCTIDMSAVYFDIIKDRLYTSPEAAPERRAAQTVLYEVIQAVVRMLTPVLAFTTEEIWQYLRREDEPASVQMTDWPRVNEQYLDPELEERGERMLKAREVVAKALEMARQQKIIGHSLGAAVIIYADDEWRALLESVADLSGIFIVSRAEVQPADSRSDDSLALETVPGLWVSVAAAPGEKCERCWIISPEVGQDDEHVTLCRRCVSVVADTSN
ncbi:MAG: isoleucine--tRNA ligase [Syntrophomonadaceae bacterium]|nr:isoleucine--tRNA ligase [Syntrophomonadaceae bacterium]